MSKYDTVDMGDTACRTMWASKIVQHTWDILVGLDRPIVSGSDEKTAAIVEAIDFYCNDDEWFLWVVAMSSLCESDSRNMVEGALIKRYADVKKYLEERLAYYDHRVEASIRGQGKRIRLPEYSNCSHDIRLALRWLEQFRDRELTPKMRDLMIRLYDVKGRYD